MGLGNFHGNPCIYVIRGVTSLECQLCWDWEVKGTNRRKKKKSKTKISQPQVGQSPFPSFKGVNYLIFMAIAAPAKSFRGSPFS